MPELTVDDIKKAMKTLKDHGVEPVEIRLHPAVKDKVIKMLNDNGIETMCGDGYEYVFGMRVITDDPSD